MSGLFLTLLFVLERAMLESYTAVYYTYANGLYTAVLSLPCEGAV